LGNVALHWTAAHRDRFCRGRGGTPEITAEDFAFLLGQNPQVAEVIADLVSSRNQKTRKLLKKIRELSEKGYRGELQ